MILLSISKTDCAVCASNIASYSLLLQILLYGSCIATTQPTYLLQSHKEKRRKNVHTAMKLVLNTMLVTNARVFKSALIVFVCHVVNAWLAYKMISTDCEIQFSCHHFHISHFSILLFKLNMLAFLYKESLRNDSFEL